MFYVITISSLLSLIRYRITPSSQFVPDKTFPRFYWNNIDGNIAISSSLKNNDCYKTTTITKTYQFTLIKISSVPFGITFRITIGEVNYSFYV